MSSTPFDADLLRLAAEREVALARQRLYRYLADSLGVIPENAEWIARELRYNPKHFTPMQQARLNGQVYLVQQALEKQLALS